MALKEYRMPDGSTWQFEEGDAPKDATLVTKPRKPAAKRRATQNKARKAEDK